MTIPTITTTARHVTFSAITPYLYYPDGDAAAAWLTTVFGFGPTRKVTDDEGRWREGDIAAGPVWVSICGQHEPTGDNGRGVLLIVAVDDVDALYDRIVAAGDPVGSAAVEPPEDKAYGPRSIIVTDPWGYRWNFWQGDAAFE